MTGQLNQKALPQNWQRQCSAELQAQQKHQRVQNEPSAALEAEPRLELQSPGPLAVIQQSQLQAEAKLLARCSRKSQVPLVPRRVSLERVRNFQS